MYNERIQYLTSKFFAGTCSPTEKLELAEWIRQHPDHKLAESLENEWLEFESDIKMPERMSERVLGNIFDRNDKTCLHLKYLGLWRKRSQLLVKTNRC